MRSAPQHDEGFTLIELLVVMIIIGILASIAIPSFLAQRRNAIATGQIADLRSVADEVEAFYVNQDQYPATVTQSGDEVTLTTATGTGTQRVTVGNTVTYSLATGGAAYCISAHNNRAAGDRVWLSSAGGIQPSSAAICPF